MADRPILFSGPMVRAILSGAKTQTRRVVTPQPEFAQLHEWRGKVIRDCEARAWCWKAHDFGDGDAVNARPGSAMHALSPYGVPGDRLWVRETVKLDGVVSFDPVYGEKHAAIFAADGQQTKLDYWPWQRNVLPAIHMPRGLCRLELEVTSVRAERLQSITEEDAKAEGVKRDTEPCDHVRRSCEEIGCLGPTHRASFCELWDSLNSKRPGCSWDAKPWVWRIAFRRVGANAEASSV